MLEDLGVPSFKQMLEENSCNKGNLGVYGGNGCNPRVAGTTRINNPSGDGFIHVMPAIFLANLVVKMLGSPHSYGFLS